MITADGISASVSASARWLLSFWLAHLREYLGVGVPLMFLAVGVAAWRFAQRRPAQARELCNALASGQMEMYYQPILDVRTLRCVSAEALLRWKHPRRGLLLPGAFLAEAETRGLLPEITLWTIKRIAVDCRQLFEQYPDFRVAVNIDPRLLLDTDFLDQLAEVIRETLLPGRITFELTENQFPDLGDDTLAERMRRLREIGGTLALDDFGTGFSGLGYLRRCTFDALKIDCVFVQALDRESATGQITASIVDLAHRLDLKTIAEGVETQAQLDSLRMLNIDYVQGWLFSKALPHDGLVDFLRAQTGETYPRTQRSRAHPGRD